MAVRISHSIEIARSATACWRIFCDVAGWPRWFPMLEGTRREQVGTFARGERMTLRLVFRGRGVDVPVRIEEVQEGRRIRWIGRNLGVTGDHSFSVEAHGEATRFTSEEVFTGLPLRLLPKRLFEELERETLLGLERFRALAESTVA